VRVNEVDLMIQIPQGFPSFKQVIFLKAITTFPIGNLPLNIDSEIKISNLFKKNILLQHITI
jgi:hypothetical protein